MDSQGVTSRTFLRLLSLALRHKPELFGIEVDSSGWADVRRLVCGINSVRPELQITEGDVRNCKALLSEERFEIRDSRIRALYGHSLRCVSIGEPKPPPPLLFHATHTKLLQSITNQGLIAKGRNNAHLTSSWDYALSVWRTHNERGRRGIILAVKTADTLFKGVAFYQANSHVWLSPYIGVTFLSFAVVDPRIPGGPSALIPFNQPDPKTREALSQNIASVFGGLDE